MRAALRLMQEWRMIGEVPGGGGGGGGTPLPPPSNFGSDIRAWMRQPGDQVLTVPDGTYNLQSVVEGTPGIVSPTATKKAATNGAYKGWLILHAQNPGGAVLDLGPTGMKWGLQNDAASKQEYRILFVGFKVQNGMVECFNGSKVGWWYCDFTFPIDVWLNQYVAAGGTVGVRNDTVRDSMKNNDSSIFRVRADLGVGSPWPNQWGWWGCDFHNVGDDGIYVQGVNSGEVRGCKFWDIYHHAKDPSNGVWMHSDAIQTEWGSNWNVTDSFIGGHIQAEAHDSGLNNWLFQDLWVAGSAYQGFDLDQMLGHTVSNIVLNRISWFANGQYWHDGVGNTVDPYYSPTFDFFFIAHNGASATQTNISHLTGASLPSGVTLTGNLLDDIRNTLYPARPIPTSIVNHASNPANLWRNTAGKGYGDWATYLASWF